MGSDRVMHSLNCHAEFGQLRRDATTLFSVLFANVYYVRISLVPAMSRTRESRRLMSV